MDIDVEYGKIEDRRINFIEVNLHTELGCDASQGEYSICITSFMGALNITCENGNSDVDLVKECIENSIDFDDLPDEGATNIILEESGEWEGYSWHKYYKVHRIIKEEY